MELNKLARRCGTTRERVIELLKNKFGCRLEKTNSGQPIYRRPQR
jgi:hypothetical protein